MKNIIEQEEINCIIQLLSSKNVRKISVGVMMASKLDMRISLYPHAYPYRITKEMTNSTLHNLEQGHYTESYAIEYAEDMIKRIINFLPINYIELDEKSLETSENIVYKKGFIDGIKCEQEKICSEAIEFAEWIGAKEFEVVTKVKVNWVGSDMEFYTTEKLFEQFKKEKIYGNNKTNY